MSNSFIRGAGYALTGLRWLPKAGLRGVVLLPLVINTVLFSVGIGWIASQFARFDQWAQSLLPGWLHWLHWLLWPLFVLTVGVVLFYTFALIANALAAPFNGLLAERVERLANPEGQAPPPADSSWRELLFSPLAELGKLLYFVVWTILLIVLSFVPGVNAAAPVFWVLFSAWMLAREYADYPLGRRGLSFRAQRRLLRRRWPLTLGFGGMTLVLTLIPVLNFVAMPAAVVGATLMWSREGHEG